MVVGFWVGADGAIVGLEVGADGITVGSNVGFWEGVNVGWEGAAVDGDTEGAMIGDADGAEDGGHGTAASNFWSNNPDVSLDDDEVATKFKNMYDSKIGNGNHEFKVLSENNSVPSIPAELEPYIE